MISKKGVSASPGVVIGPALVLDTEEYRIPRRTVAADQVRQQIVVLEEALDASRQEVNDLRVAAARKLGEQTASIFAFHEGVIADPKLRDEVLLLIRNNQYTAAYAFAQVMHARQKLFQNVTVEYLKERVRDLYDIEKRVLRHVLGRAREDITRLTEPVVLVTHDLTPSQAVSIDRDHILGLATNVGGQTSHMAIIARMLGIPSVVALNDITSDLGGGETVVIDGSEGVVVVDPDPATIDEYREKQIRLSRKEAALETLRDVPAVTRCGTPIAMWANIELAEETGAALHRGGEGVGLYRTEFLFLSADRLPTEAQQVETFRQAAESMQGKPLVIRTIDLGADKLLPSSSLGQEHNPVLGLRSLRYCLRHLDMFKTHLRAILRASVAGDVRIMFPMITTVTELRNAKATLADVMEDLEEEGIDFRRDIPVGMMVETPAAAMTAPSFAKEVEFFSIGTNDLTQYTLAVDRANERVAYLYSPHSPSVLLLIRRVLVAARRHKVAVHLCGEMAGTPEYTQLLLGLGIRRLSMSPQDIPSIKRVIRSTTIDECDQIATKVMRLDSDRQVWNHLRSQLAKLPLEESA